ncbi:MAG TPA: hypothetical protein PLS08_12390, partial [Chryseolinea sp.]|nr:hypothetical protein [Chryseolinea sp.]
KQLAECKASGKEYFITEDEDIIKRRDQIYDTLKISVMNPVEFILEIDELRNSQLYEPARFGGARHEIRKVDSENLQSIIAQFLHLDSGITRNNFRNLIKITVSDAKHSNVKIISSPENSAIGIFGYTKSSDSLEVKFIRAKTTVLSNTLITQILFELIKESVELEINRLVISNAIIENRQEVISILEDLGFFSDGENWIKLSFKGCISFSEFFDSHQDLYKFSVILKIYNSILSIQNGGSRDALLFQLEKMLWPQKFLI